MTKITQIHLYINNTITKLTGNGQEAHTLAIAAIVHAPHILKIQSYIFIISLHYYIILHVYVALEHMVKWQMIEYFNLLAAFLMRDTTCSILEKVLYAAEVSFDVTPLLNHFWENW